MLQNFTRIQTQVEAGPDEGCPFVFVTQFVSHGGCSAHVSAVHHGLSQCKNSGSRINSDTEGASCLLYQPLQSFSPLVPTFIENQGRALVWRVLHIVGKRL